MTHTRFREVIYRKRKTGKCPSCGKSAVRMRMFYQTLNPFNKNSAGEVKTAEEIYEELKAEAEAWQPDFRHATEECGG